MPIEHSPTRLVKGSSTEHTTSVEEKPFDNPYPEAMNNDGEGSKSANIDAVQAVRLPPFWKDNPALWFAQVEAAFAIHRITSDESKFRYIVLNADQPVLPFVADLITNPPEQDKYQTLKDRICSILGETSATKIRRLLGSHELGDEKPSIFLQRLRNLAAGQVTDEILKSIFMEQLPESVRTILAISEVQDLAKLVAQADKVVEMARPAATAIQTITEKQTDADNQILQEIAELRKQVKKLSVRDKYRRRSRSRGHSSGRERADNRERSHHRQDREGNAEYCYYHNRFGDKAFRCAQPCTFNKLKAVEN
ncbi:hypothetical protein CAJAP_07477 [Camponotus japonicus]